MGSESSRYGRLLIVLLIGVTASQSLFAGKEFLAGPGEAVVADQLLVGLQHGADISRILASLVPQSLASVVSLERNTYLLRLPPGIQAVASKLLAAHPLVQYVEPNRIRHTTVLPPNDAMLTQQWALTNIHAIDAWNYFPDRYLTAANSGVNRVKVAILDSGADCTHPDFMNAGGASTNSAQGGQFDYADSQALVATTISSPACPWQDDKDHGTHVAGILGAATNNAAGVASLGFPLQLMIFKVLDSTGSGSDSDVAQAIDLAVQRGAQVISMSLGGTGYSQTLQSAMDFAWESNVLVVAATGNGNGNALVYPGEGNHVLGVAATDSNNLVANFSNYGNGTKIAAPGVNVYSTLPNDSYGNLSGTSMATPHAAALAGLLRMANPGLSAAAIAQRIQQTAQTPNTGWDQYIGYGVINAGAALGGIPGPATLGSFAGQVVDSSNNPITGAQVTAGGQSFTTALDASSGSANGLFRIANLSPGTYTITVTALGFSTVQMQGVVMAGADTMLTIPMGVTLGEFTGSVTYNGAAVAGAAVSAVSGGANPTYGNAVTNSSGAYILYAPAGTYTLTASAPNYIDVTLGGQVLSGSGAVTANLPLSALGRITGTVFDGNGVGVANAHIDFTSGSFSGGAVTVAGGNYATFGIPSISYTLTASASGYNTVTQSGVSVTTNTSTLVNFQFSTGIALASGLLGYWPFDEDAGSVANDQSGHGYNVTLSNTAWTAGKLNSALSFNGSNSAGVTPAIPFNNAFSVSAWVNPAVTTQASFAAIAETNLAAGLYLGVDTTGTKYKFIVNSGTGSTGSCGSQYGCAEGGTVAAGWHLVTGTYDGATAVLCVDGATVANDTATAPSSVSLPLEIGRSVTSSAVWNGVLDDMRLYSRALTGSEVTTLFSGANLLLTKTADAATVSAGTSIGYSLAVTNSGPGTATSAILSDVLPAGTGIAWSISPAYSGPGTCSMTSGTLSCVIGNLTPGGTTSVHITSDTSTASCAAYQNTATVSAGNSSSIQSNATTTVLCPSLNILETHQGAFTQGQPGVTYTVTVSNGSPIASTTGPVKVSEIVPAGLTLVSMAGTGWTCPAGETMCSRGDPLNAGTSYQALAVTMNVASDAAAQVTNQVTVSGGGSSPATANDLTTVLPFTCAVSGDPVTSVADVQTMIDEALGVTLPVNDLNHDGVVNVADVQKVIGAILGQGCLY